MKMETYMDTNTTAQELDETAMAELEQLYGISLTDQNN